MGVLADSGSSSLFLPFFWVEWRRANAHSDRWNNAQPGTDFEATLSPTPIPVLLVHNITRNAFFSTIQAAIKDAQERDEIVVSPGTYSERIDFQGKKLCLSK